MKTVRNRSISGGNGSSSLYRDLRDRISRLDFTAFQILVALWLGAKGYSHMRSLGRHSARGRRKIGGADFIAHLPNTEGFRVAVQIRHWRTPVTRRALDELLGFMRREGIGQGLIITCSGFLPSVCIAAAKLIGRPIRLVSGAQLAGWMAALGLGVTPQRESSDPKLFRTLDGLRFARNAGAKMDSSGGLTSVPNGHPSPGPLWLPYLIGAIGTLLISILVLLKLRRSR